MNTEEIKTRLIPGKWYLISYRQTLAPKNVTTDTITGKYIDHIPGRNGGTFYFDSAAFPGFALRPENIILIQEG
jgi:hypothetical protein